MVSVGESSDPSESKMDLRQSPEWGKFLGTLGWQTEVLDGCALRIKRLGPFGSIIKIQRPERLPLAKINEVAKRHRALFVKIEPEEASQSEELTTAGYSPDLWPLTPSRTVVLDLKKSEEQLLASFSKDTRQSIKKSAGENLRTMIYRPSSSPEFEQTLETFYEIFRETGRAKGFWVPPLRELRSKCQNFASDCLLVLSIKSDHQNGVPATDLPLSGIIILISGETAYYHHAASTKLGQKLKAPYLTLWESIRKAKTLGCQKMDLEGIFDPRFPSTFKKWISFSVFKLKWAGQVIEYPPTYTKFFNGVIRLLSHFVK